MNIAEQIKKVEAGIFLLEGEIQKDKETIREQKRVLNKLKKIEADLNNMFTGPDEAVS